MSRRKQGRPQQRKAIDPVEQENDLLVCGSCNTNFPLQDILKFIRHKVNRCDKENADVEGPDLDGDDQSDPEAVSVGSNFKTSISAPIIKKDLIDSKLSSRSSLEYLKDAILQVRNVHDGDDKLFDLKYSRSPLKPKLENAETNTIHTEPIQLVCECCSNVFTSAWSLLQHAQTEHRIRLYREELDLSPTPPKQQKLLESPQKESPHNRPSPGLNPNSPHHHRRPQSHRSDNDVQERHEEREQHLAHVLSQDQHRTPSVASSIGSTESGHVTHPHRQSPQNIFMNAFRFPYDRHSISPHNMPFPRLPGTEFHPMTSEALHITQRGLLGFPPNIFDPGRPFPSISGMFDRPRPNPPSNNPLEPPADSFYSKRLKELARGPPSPIARRQTPPFSQSSGQSPTPLFSPLNPSPHSISESTHKEQPSSGVSQGNKLKSCEFCGKSFRFQSNLIVHRRSHTGEKPFKCTLCPHACTQQSKLKRHMKTHMNKSNSNNNIEGQLGSGNSTPDSRGVYIDRDEDNEDDDMEDEEEEECEEEEFERDDDMEEECQTNNYQHKKEIDSRSEQNHSLLASKLESTSPNESSGGKGVGLLPFNNKASMLTEMMKNSGLTNLSVYNEAFKQAMDETIKTEKTDSKPSSENGSSLSNGNINDDSKEETGNQESSRPASDSENEVKSLKREQDSPMINNFMGMENMFNPLWTVHPPPPELYPLLPSHFQPRFDRDPNHNNFNPTSDSALKSLNQGLHKTGRPSPEDMNGLGSNIRRDNKRNDTCEFCGKVFKNCSNLTVHRRSHTGEKPYKCELCSYACAQSSKLTRHMKTHGRVGKDVYRCKFCAMPFSVASTLEKHMRKCVEKCQGRILPDTDSDTNEGSDRGAPSHISSPLLPPSSHSALLGGSPIPSSGISTSLSPLMPSSSGNSMLSSLASSTLLAGSILPPSSHSAMLPTTGSPVLSHSSATTNA